MKVLHYDAFSQHAGKGNPAGIVLDADALTDDDMLRIAGKVGFNETAFLLSSVRADLRMRFFTPGQEMELCGHATIAGMYCLHERGLLGGQNVSIETNAGILPISISRLSSKTLVEMQQLPPVFEPYEGDAQALAAVLGIDAAYIDGQLPTLYGSTGAWTLLVPITSPEAFAHMQPDNATFPGVLSQFPRCSIHPFCLHAHNASHDIYSRHFSSPYSGTVEDPVTGTASGVLGGYYATYIHPGRDSYSLVMGQGAEIGREGEVYVYVHRSQTGLSISIAGTAAFVREISIH